MKDYKILLEIQRLAISLQDVNPLRVYYKARIIEFLSEIVRLHSTETVNAFLKWLDTDEERKYYNDNLFPALGIEL